MAKASQETLNTVKDAVDHEKMIIELQGQAVRMEARIDDLQNAMNNLIDIVSTINDKIATEGLPLPAEVNELLKGKEAWVWLAVIHAVMSGMFQNQVYMRDSQMPAAFEKALQSASVFQEILIKKATPVG